MQGVHKGTLAEHLGIRFVEATPERVVAELDHRPALTTVGGALHGGTLMALADTVGAAATFLNLPAVAGTTTRESKTTLVAAGQSGTTRADATPLPRGRRTHVWQTRVRGPRWSGVASARIVPDFPEATPLHRGR